MTEAGRPVGPDEPEKPTEQKEEFVSEVRRRRERHEKFQREGDASFWSSVGMMGTIGFSIAVPLTLGTLLGRWLDGRFDAGYTFMIFLMLAGLGVGIFTVYRLIRENL